MLRFLRERLKGRVFRPLVSVDTRRASTARRALAEGADWINDVSGLADPSMLGILRESQCGYVLMHSLSVPASGKISLPAGTDPVAEIKAWALGKIKELTAAGIDLDRVLFDPGIGFGKTAGQSLELLRRAREFHELPGRLLVGHSRKSFLRLWAGPGPAAAELDIESVALSLRLAASGVDILRVHEPKLHIRARRAFQEGGPWNR
jgi:dihydropteroate synthase